MVLNAVPSIKFIHITVCVSPMSSFIKTKQNKKRVRNEESNSIVLIADFSGQSFDPLSSLCPWLQYSGSQKDNYDFYKKTSSFHLCTAQISIKI